MPIYDFLCEQCGTTLIDQWAKIEEDRLPCGCGHTLVRQIGATRSNPDWQPYYDEHLCVMGQQQGTVVKSRQHRTEVMRRLGVVDKWGTGHQLGER